MKTAVKEGLPYYHWLVLGLVCFGWAVTRVAAGGPVFQIPDSVIVRGPNVSVMDLGSLDGAGAAEVTRELKTASLGVAPQPGKERTFSKDYVTAILRQHHLENLLTLRMGAEVIIKRDSVHITGEELTKQMETQLPPLNSDCIARRLEAPGLAAGIWLEKGELRTVVKPLGKIPEQGTIVFQIDFFVNEVKKRTIHQRAEIKINGLVYQAKRTINPREELTEADFRVSEAEIGNRQQYYGKFPERCRVVKKIGPGETLNRNSFQQIPLVKKGDPLTAVLKLEGLEIKVTAQAERDGWLGDEIRVANSASKQVFQAKVIGRNRVEVKME